MASDVESEIKTLHNQMVFEINRRIKGETLEEVKYLFNDDPLNLAEISEITNIRTLFNHLIKYERIDYGNYQEFVSKIKVIHPQVCTLVQEYTKKINKLQGNLNDQDAVFMDEYEYNAKPGSGVFLSCDVEPKPETIQWKKGKNKRPPPPKEDISIDNHKYFSGPEAPTLIIKKTEKDDESYYQCIARRRRNAAFSPIVHLQIDEVGELEHEEKQEVSEQVTSQGVVEQVQETQRPTPEVKDSSLDVADTHRSRPARNREQPIWMTNADGVEPCFGNRNENQQPSYKSMSGATEKSSVSRCRRKSWPMIEKREKVTTGKRVLSIPPSLFDALKCVLSFLITNSIDVRREALSSDIQNKFAEVTGSSGRAEVSLIPQCVLVRIEINEATSLTEPSALHLAEMFKHYILNGGVIQLSDESNTILTVDKTSLKITPQHVPEDGSPYVSISQGDFTGSKGKMIFLQTYIIASPSVSAIQWFKVNEGDKLRPIEIDNKRYFGGSDLSPTLIIRNVNREDQGCYFCIARNEKGIGSSHRTFIRIDTAQSEAKRPGMGEKEQQKGPSEAKRSRIGEKDQQKAKEKSSESVISVVATDRQEPNVGDGITSQGVMKQNVSDVTAHHVILKAQVSDVSTGREVMEPDISHVTSGQRVLEPQVGNKTTGRVVVEADISDLSTNQEVMETNVYDVSTGRGVMEINVSDNTTGLRVMETKVGDLSTNQEVVETDVYDVSTGHAVMKINVSDDTTGLRVRKTKVGDVSTGQGVMETDISDDTSCMGVMETEVCDGSTGPCVLETEVCDYTTGLGDMETKLSDDSIGQGVMETDISDDTSGLEVIKTEVCDVSTGQDVKLNPLKQEVRDDSNTASDKNGTKDPQTSPSGQMSGKRPADQQQIRKFHTQMVVKLGGMFSPKQWSSICNQVEMIEYVTTRDMDDIYSMEKLSMALMRKGVISYGEYSNLREILVTYDVQAGDIIDDFTSKIRQEMEEIHPDLKPMIDTTKARINKDKKERKFYTTKGFRDAKDKLLQKKVVVIKGNTGDGKTAIAIQLIHWLNQEKQDLEPLQIHKIKILDLLTRKLKLITFIDDIFGEKDVYKKDVSEWNKRISDIKTCFVDEEATNFLVITIRNEVYNSLETCSCEIILTDDHTIDLSSNTYKIEEEKKALIELYMPKEFSDEEKDKIVTCAPNIGFPQCCQLFSNSVELQKERVNFFKNPRHFLEKALSKLPDCSVLLYLFFNDGMIKVKDLDPNSQNVDKKLLEEAFDISLISGQDDSSKLSYKKKVTFVKESLKKLLGFLVMTRKHWRSGEDVYGFEDVYRFYHDSIYAAVAHLYWKATPVGYIQNCPSKCLSYLTTSKTATNMIVISSDHYTDMCERLLREFECKKRRHDTSVGSLDVWKDPVFVNRFVGLLNERKVDKLTVLNGACRSGAEECALYLLCKERVKPDKDTVFGVVDGRSISLLRKLLEYDVTPTARGYGGNNVLHAVCGWGTEEMVTLICDTYPHLVHDINDVYGQTPLHRVAEKGNVGLFQTVERCVLNSLYRVENQQTKCESVNGCVVHKYCVCAQYMSQLVDKYGATVLHWSCLSGNVNKEICLYLCRSYPGLIPIVDMFGQHCLHHIAWWTGDVDVFTECETYVKQYVESTGGKYDVTTILDKNGMTVLHHSCGCGDRFVSRKVNREVCLYLCRSYPGLIPIVDKEGQHCLHHIAWSTSDVDVFTECETYVKQYVESTGGKYDVTTILDNDGKSVLDKAKEGTEERAKYRGSENNRLLEHLVKVFGK